MRWRKKKQNNESFPVDSGGIHKARRICETRSTKRQRLDFSSRCPDLTENGYLHFLLGLDLKVCTIAVALFDEAAAFFTGIKRPLIALRPILRTDISITSFLGRRPADSDSDQ
jgi:hypothetical protein